MVQTAREVFYERIEAAPLAVIEFFESIDTHFRQRNDVDVRFTYTNVADMRLWGVWETKSGKQGGQVFATMTWQPKKQAVFARTKLRPDEFAYFGFESATWPKAEKEPQNSEIQLFEEQWRYGALSFIRALEGARIKMSPSQS